jgi:hypothetical protein
VTFIYNIKRLDDTRFMFTVSDEYFGPEVVILTGEELLRMTNDIRAVVSGEKEEARSHE